MMSWTCILFKIAEASGCCKNNSTDHKDFPSQETVDKKMPSCNILAASMAAHSCSQETAFITRGNR